MTMTGSKHRSPRKASARSRDTDTKAGVDFSALGLTEPLLRAVEAAGYSHPTPIQRDAIPPALAGRDVLGFSQTGTGKTAAFVLPILQHLRRTRYPRRQLPLRAAKVARRLGRAPGRVGKGARPRALILSPTRELALQIGGAIEEYGQFTDLRHVVTYGGVKLGAQEAELLAGVDIVVATPGRLLDHLRRANLNFDDLQVLVLDEADRMLDMGFLPDVEEIISRLPEERQTMMFSATLDKQTQRLAGRITRDPVTVEVAPQHSTAEGITHLVFPTPAELKLDLLLDLLEEEECHNALIFVRTKERVEEVASSLSRCGVIVERLHSDRSQSRRESALQGFRDGRIQFLVATDVASRGLDIEGISHVINFDVPLSPEDYVHRAGRTARAEKTGVAITLVEPRDANLLHDVERFLERDLPRNRFPGYPQVDVDGRGPGRNGGGRSRSGRSGRRRSSSRSRGRRRG